MTAFWYLRLPIAQKLRLLMMIGGLFFIVCFGCIYTYYGSLTLQSTLVKDTVNSANLVGSRSAAAIIFMKPESANDNLENLNLDDSYNLICLYDAKGAIFTKHSRLDLPCPDQFRTSVGMFNEFAEEKENHITVLKSILSKNEIVGAVLIERSNKALNGYVYEQLKTMLIIMTISTVFGYPITHYLQRFISKPLMEMTQSIQHIAGEPFLDHRISRTFNDELGKVVDAFNCVLSTAQEDKLQMQKKLNELEDHNRHLLQSMNIMVTHLENVVDYHSETEESFMIYSEMINKHIFGSEIDVYRPYQEDVASSLATYTSHVDTLMHATKLYALAITGPRTNINVIDEIELFVRKIRTVVSHVDIIDNSVSRNTANLEVFKLAWDEIFKIIRHLMAVLSTLVEFHAAIRVEVSADPLQVEICLFDKDAPPRTTSTTVRAFFNHLAISAFEISDELPYKRDSIEDPSVAEEFLNGQLPRADMQFILHNINYIANANSISTDHFFQNKKFAIKLDLSNVVRSRPNQADQQMVLQ